MVHRVAFFGALATFFLIVVGGLVTSKSAGMSVPDWPTTYGYNMFLFPYSRWVGGIFWEHSHRLLASGIGLITLVLAVAVIAVQITPLGHWMRSWSLIWAGGLLLQILLGGITIWSNKAADVATAHMALGAVLTGFALLFTFRLFCAASGRSAPSAAEPCQPLPPLSKGSFA